MKLLRKTPCKECPFRKIAAPGWLGPWTAMGMIQQAHSEAGLGCHVSAAEEKENPDTTHICVGSLQNANISFKSYRDSTLREWAKAVGNGLGRILDFRAFLQHHKDAKGEVDEQPRKT